MRETKLQECIAGDTAEKLKRVPTLCCFSKECQVVWISTRDILTKMRTACESYGRERTVGATSTDMLFDSRGTFFALASEPGWIFTWNSDQPTSITTVRHANCAQIASQLLLPQLAQDIILKPGYWKQRVSCCYWLHRGSTLSVCCVHNQEAFETKLKIRNQTVTHAYLFLCNLDCRRLGVWWLKLHLHKQIRTLEIHINDGSNGLFGTVHSGGAVVLSSESPSGIGWTHGTPVFCGHLQLYVHNKNSNKVQHRKCFFVHLNGGCDFHLGNINISIQREKWWLAHLGSARTGIQLGVLHPLQSKANHNPVASRQHHSSYRQELPDPQLTQ